MSISYLLGEKLDLAVLHLETLLDEGGQLANALGLLTKNVLGAGGQDDDLGTLGGDADLDTGVAILGQFLNHIQNLPHQNTINYQKYSHGEGNRPTRP